MARERENSCQFWWPLTEKLKVREIAVFLYSCHFFHREACQNMMKDWREWLWHDIRHRQLETHSAVTHTLPLGVNCCNLCYASQREVRRRWAAAGAFTLKQVYLTLEKCAGDFFNPFKARACLSARVTRSEDATWLFRNETTKCQRGKWGLV